MAILRNDTVVKSADGQHSSAIITAANIGSHSIAPNSTYFIGTTQNVFNRASGAQTLTGVNIDGNSGGIYAAGGASIKSSTTGTAYTSHIQIREADGGGSNTSEIYAPALGFHWAGVVASNILMESSGRIAIRNNPGSGYENFIAAIIYAGSSVQAPIFYDSNNTSYYLDPANSGTSLLVAGSIGAGLTTPLHKIQASGLISASDATYNNDSTFIGAILNNDGTNPGLDLRRWNGGAAGTNNHGTTYIATNSAGDTIFYNGLIAANTRATNEKMRIAVNGNVGIGTTSPGSKLDVNGTFRTAINNLTIFNDYIYVSPTENNTLNSAYFTNGIADMWINYAGYNNGNTQFRNFNIGNGRNGVIAWFDGTNKRVSINNNQAASYPLHVVGTAYSDTDFRAPIFYDSANTAYYLDAANSGTSLLVAGKVGIGTTSPAYKLDVGASGSDAISVRLTPGFERVRYYGFDLLGYNDGNLWMIGNNATNTLVLGGSWDWDRQIAIAYTPATTGAAGGSLEIGQMTKNNANFTHGNTRFYTNGIERVRINSSGNVGMGTTSPSAKLHIYNSTAVDTLLESGTSGTTGKLIFKTSDNADLNKYIMQESYYMILNGHANEGFKFRDSASNVLLSIFGAANTYASRVGIGTQTPAYKLDVSGAINASTYMYAGVFYDNDNTAFYANPSGASIFNGLKLVSSGNQVSGDDYSLWIQGGNDDWGIGIDKSSANYGITYNLATSHTYAIQGRKNGTEYFRLGTDMLSHDTRLQAPIFYDSNNTAYYIDGASGSKLKYLQIDGDWASSPFGSGHESFTIRSTYASMVQRQTNEALAYWLHHIAGNGAYHLYGGRGATDGSSWDWAYRAYPNQDGNYVEFNTSARAQIFYDRNDTNYYLDPASTSRLNTLNVVGAVSGARGVFSDSSGSGSAVIEAYNTVATNGTTAIFRQTTAGGNGNQDIGLLVDIQGAADTDRIANFRYYNGSTYTSRMAIMRGGNVGIGTTSPSNPLHINTSANEGILVQGSTAGSWMNFKSSTSNLLSIGADGTLGLGFYNRTSSTYLAIISNSGSLGIGTTSPSQKLHVVGTGFASTDFRAPIFYDSDNTTYYLDPNASTSGNLFGVLKQNDGKFVRDSYFRTISGVGDYYASGASGWYTVASITLTTNCTGGVLYGTLYDNRYDGADTYQIAIVARAECDFTTNNESHYVNVGCTILGSTNIINYQSKIRVLLVASSTNSRTYEVQFLETAWNRDTWQLETGGSPVWTIYSTAQAPGTSTGTARVFYISNKNADNIRANTASYSPIYYDSSDTSYYSDPAGLNRFNALNIGNQGALTGNTTYALGAYHNSRYMVGLRYSSGGAAYPWLVHDSWNGSAFIIHFNGVGDRFHVSESGIAYVTGDFRAPIFYDSNNTSYYLDPASTSNLNALVVAASGRVGGAASRSTSGLTVGFTDNSTFAANTDVGDTDRMLSIVNESSTTNAMSVLGFRVNPNGGTANAMLDVKFVQTGATNTSALHYTFNHGGTFADRFSILSSGNVGIGTTSPTQLLDVRGNIKLGGDNSGNYVYYVTDIERTIVRTTRSDVTQEGLLRSDGWGNFTFSNNIGVGLSLGTGYGVGSVGSGIVYANGSVRAPIFYDSSDTNYYVDPAGTSRVNTLYVANVLADSASGNGRILLYGNLHIDAYGANDIYCNYYSGRRFRTYKGAATGAETFRADTDGIIYAFEQFRTPIVYDHNNTAYYLDPASTSNLNALTVAGGNATIYRDLIVNGGASGSFGNRIIVQGTATTYTLQDTTFRPTVYLNGDYPVVTLNCSATTNTNHGPTLQFAFNGLTTGGSTSRQVVIGANGIGSWLDFGFSGGANGDNTSYNPHNGIAGYNGITPMRLFSNGLLLGSTGAFPNHITSTSFALDVRGTGSSNTDFRAPIFYDSNDTNYYIDPASTSLLNTLRLAGSLQNNGSVSDDDNFGIYWDSGGSSAYAIYREAGSWTNPFPDLRIAFHTGIKIGANAGYNGIRFYDDYTMATQVMSINNSGDGLGANNVYVNNALQAGGSLRAPIFYDSNDTTYYGDFASTSWLRQLSVGDVNAANDGGWNARLNLTGSQHARLDVKSNSDGIITTIYSHTGNAAGKVGTMSNHPLVFMVNGNAAGYAYANYLQGADSVRAPIFYDSDNTGYYLNPAGNSQVVSIYANDWFRAQGNTGLYFQDKGYGITSAGAASNSYGNASTYGTGLNGWQGWGIGSRHCMMSTGGDNFGIHDNTRSWLYYWDGTYHNFQYGYLQSASSVRGPLFYDSNDTGYYLDPASTSNLNSLVIAGTLTSAAYNNLANDYKDIYVYGDVNTYYVVLIQGEYIYSFGRYSVTRGYNWNGPDTWNTASHKGGLTLDWEWSGDTAWGGNDKAIRIIEFNESYSNMVAGLGYPVNGGVIIWLRGGGVNGAQYRIRTPNGSNSVVTVYDGVSAANHSTSTTFTAADSTVFSTRANTNNVSAEIFSRYPVRATGSLFNDGNAVLDQGSTSQTKSGILSSSASLRAPIFYDTDDTAYLGDFASRRATSINGFTARTKMTLGLTAKYQEDRADYTGDTSYWVGAMGWINVDMNTLFDYGCGFIDTWNNPGNQPSGTSHWTGIQSMHFTNGTARYGWQMVGGPIQNLRFRNTWSTFTSWKTIPVLDVNDGNSGAMYAGVYYDSNNTTYYVDPASTSNLVGLTVANTITGSITGNAGGSSASCSGNAATATILQTARTIGGVSFNGSANINLPGVNTAGNQNTTGTAANVTGTVAIANGGTGATTAAAARSNLGIPAAETSSNQSLSGSTTCTIDVAAANVHILALASGTTISSFTYNNRSASPLVNTILVVLKFAGTATVTWSNVVWSNGTTPTLTGVNGKADVYSLTSYKGGTTGPAWIGSVVGQNMDSTNL